MWHFLHLLAGLMEGLPVTEELVFDYGEKALIGTPGRLLDAFLPLFGGLSKHRCFSGGTYGLPHISLAGYDKGDIHSLLPLRNHIYSHWGRDVKKNNGWCFVDRAETLKRQLLNKMEVLGIIREFRPVFVADLGDMSVVQQWLMASSVQVLVGVHGAGLTWSAFLNLPAAVVELHPYARVYGPGELCLYGRNATPWHAYGGIATLVPGLLHLCYLGQPLPGKEYRVSNELASWPHEPVLMAEEAIYEAVFEVEGYLQSRRESTLATTSMLDM